MPFWTIGCLYGASSVMLGAFGAHGLKKRIADPAKLTNWSTAAHYQVRSPFRSIYTYSLLGSQVVICALDVHKLISQ